MSGVVTTEREVRFARAFITAIRGNSMNGALLLAVIAWIRQMGSNWTGNNPLSITIRGTRQRYATFTAGARAAASYLMQRTAYTMLIRRARDSAGTDQRRQDQALDFMILLAASPYRKDHFGMAAWVDPGGRWMILDETSRTRVWYDPPGRWVMGHDDAKNRLIQTWASLTGHRIPPSWFQDTIAPAVPRKEIPPPPAPFRQEQARVHRFPFHEYIQPYEVAGFYRARPHLGQFILKPEGLVE